MFIEPHKILIHDFSFKVRVRSLLLTTALQASQEKLSIVITIPQVLARLKTKINLNSEKQLAVNSPINKSIVQDSNVVYTLNASEHKASSKL